MSAQPEQIAHYRIAAKLGEGGMGAVYRASDTKLNRDVAIKVLPPAFAEDPARMHRFEREAQILAALNHPNIATVYGIEQGALVMELVEGADLRGPLPVEEAIPIARQIALGLEAAHERGIVHRDLKPANIKLTPAGVVKILDFGLAKSAGESAAGAAAGNRSMSPTLSMGMTQAGMILGTAAYMSPEQARGKPVDKRADIWAFGVVLYEMLTGRQLFGGETVTDTLASVVKDAPSLEKLPAATPVHIRRLIGRCLTKDPQMRLRDIGEARIALEQAQTEPAATLPVEARRARWPYLIAAICAVAGIAAAVGWWRATRPVERPMLNMSVDLGPDAVVGTRVSLAISPDGNRLVYRQGYGGGPVSLAIRELDQPKGTVLTGTAGDDQQPFFSPDGQWIGFFADRKLKKIPVSGGAPIPLCDAPNPRGGSWGEDGRIFFVPGSTSGVFAVSENGGAPEQLTKAGSGEVTHRWPQRLPGGDAFLFNVNHDVTNWETGEVVVWAQKTRQRKTLVRGGYFGRYLPNGYLVYVREGKLFAERFDISRLEVSGHPQVVLDDVLGGEQSGSGQFDCSRNGLLVYLAGKGISARYAFGWMKAGGGVEPLKGAEPDHYSEPRLSPDGKQLALMNPDTLMVWDFAREAMTRLPALGDNPWSMSWTPDGRHLVYGTRGTEYDMLWRRSDGSGEPVKLLRAADSLHPYTFSPDGRILVYGAGTSIVSAQIWTLSIDAADPDHPKAGTPQPFADSAAGEIDAALSPDGRWLAYTSPESGRREIYVRPFRGSGKFPISSGGGNFPKWSYGGHQLFYLTSDWHVMVVDYSVTGESFIPGKPRRWSEAPINPTGGRSSFDVAADGKRILAFPGEAEASAGNLHATFLVNFFDELKRRMP